MVSDNPETFADLDGHGQYGGFHLGITGDANVPQETSADALDMFESAVDPSTFGTTPDVVFANGSGQNQNQQPLSEKSKEAINRAMGRDPGRALLWEYAILHAAAKNGVDPNLLVGLAAKESSLNPDAKNGVAQGMFQITPGRQADLGLSNHDLFNANMVVNAVAGSLASAMKAFNGNSGLAIASWTVGVRGTKAAFNARGMQGVRNLMLDSHNPSYGRVGHDYIDVVTSFQPQ